MTLYYIKRASNQDVTRTVVVNAGAVHDFFGLDLPEKHDFAFIQVKYLPGKTYEKVKVVKKQDARLLIQRNFMESDILLFTAKGSNQFDLDTINRASARYRVYELALDKAGTNFILTNELPQTESKLHDCVRNNDDDDDAHEVELLLKGSTEVIQLIKARRGQGVFRQRVAVVEAMCRLTRVDVLEYLRASHIKPWRKSDDREKLDGNNGLMLAPHVDLLFDSGLISFENDGSLIVSCKVDPQILAAWNVPVDFNAGAFNRQQCVYLEHHRTEELQS